jgi:hypothetical protein
MRILDIDLDIFLDNIKLDARTGFRPSDSELKPWLPSEVRLVLEQKWGLSKANRVPGAVFSEHDELFNHLRHGFDTDLFESPIDLIHADAHADVGLAGMNGTAFHFVTTQWLAKPPQERIYPPTTGGNRIFNGSWLLYAMACRWIRSLTYVHHPKLRKKNIDFPIGLIENEKLNDMVIQLNLVEDGGDRYKHSKVVSAEPPIPFRFASVLEFVAESSFDRVYLTHSPGYVPPAADALLEVISEYIDTSIRKT